MKTFTRKNTLAAVVLAAATVGLPTMAQAGHSTTSNSRYENCKQADTEGQIAGGILGAVLGGVAGSEIAGRGDRDEGAVIGAVVGAVAGAAIADKDCRNRSTYRNTGYNQTYGTTNRTYGSNRGYRTVSHYPSTNRGYGNSRRGNGYGYGNNRNRNVSYTPYRGQSHVCSSGESRLDHINWQLKELRNERKYLERQRDYRRYDRGIDRRMWQIGEEIDRLKREKKRIKKGYRHRDDHYYGYRR